MKKRILSLIPDRLEKPMGGLGYQYLALHDELSSEFELHTICFPHLSSGFEFPNTKQIFPSFVPTNGGNINPLVFNLAHQINFFVTSLGMPKPDLVHAYDWPVYMPGGHLSNHFNVPLVCSLNLAIRGQIHRNLNIALDPTTKDGKTIQETLLEMETGFLRWSDKIITISKFYLNIFPEFSSKMSLVPNGIDLRKWKSNNPNPKKKKNKIVYIGRFCEMKGVDKLLESNIPEGIELWIIGSPDGGDLLCNKLLDQKLQEGKKNMFYLGPKHGSEKIDVLNDADGVIMPSVHEPFGLVALEAMASNCVLLSSRRDGLSDFVNSENSIFVDPTVEGIEQGFLEFLNLSEERKDYFREQGRKTCQKYTWSSAGEKMAEVYRELLN